MEMNKLSEKISVENVDSLDHIFEDDDFMTEYTLKKLEKAFEVHEYKDETELIKLTVTKTMIIHFYEPSYKTCKSINEALKKLTKKFPGVHFGFISVYDCPLMVESLKIQTLPFLGFFKEGYFVDELIGFEKLDKSKKTGILNVDELENYIKNSIISKN